MSAKNMMEETKVKLYDLKVNYQKNPMGIDLHNPVFSWKIKESKGTCQVYTRCFPGARKTLLLESVGT